MSEKDKRRQFVSCGAPIELYAHKCSYCGMVYDDGYWTGAVQYVPLHMGRRKLVSKAEVPDMVLDHAKDRQNTERLASFVKSQIVDDLAKGLAEVATFKIWEDPMRMVTIVRGEVWVEEPDSRAAHDFVLGRF